ncbi:hypothetical protein IFM89_012176 [Coptis chinensis]|uniref:Carboxypeptidase n=1 Tax=Coptis chinensis TaxID=261450 RepID=A0A835LR38_9MAGN|nr:hypothetical protein IFM89_012176 [Coptis chinensis]
MKKNLILSSALPSFLLLISLSSASIFNFEDDLHFPLSNQVSPKSQAEKLIHSLNLFPKDAQPVNYKDDPLVSSGKKIVEKPLRLADFVDGNSSGGVAVEDLGHHAGYYKLAHSHAARLFYFFFESRSNKTDPVVIWLTGGPGCSSELALFYENGPFKIADNLSLVWNEYGWDKASNLLYVDQPTGTGFSYSSDSRDLRHDEEGVRADVQLGYGKMYCSVILVSCSVASCHGKTRREAMVAATVHFKKKHSLRLCGDEADGCTNWKCLEAEWLGNVWRASCCIVGKHCTLCCVEEAMFVMAFFTEHPEFAKNDFYITGESYAGHYIPAFAARVHQGNKAKEGIHINLKGFAIGNGLTNPAIQYKAYTDYALDAGLIKESQYKRINKILPTCELAIKLCGTDGKITCLASLLVCTTIFQRILSIAGNINYYDIRKECVGSLCYDFSNLEKFLNQRELKVG